MIVAVVGLGSMGKRRIRLLKGIHENITIYGIDSNPERAQQVQKEYNLKGNDSNLEQLLEKISIDSLIVCSSPLTHKDYVLLALEKGINTFSEINLTDDAYNDIIKISEKKGLITFLSSTFMYRKEVQWIKQNVIPGNSFYRYHIGQYLPDWHPWESYKDFFVNDKKTNGCREIMAIEFPWLINTFGEIVEFKVIKSKKTKLDLDYPDVYQILFEHGSGASGTITIDLVSRKSERALQIISEEKQIEWGGTPESLYNYDIDEKSMRKISLYDDIDRESGYASNIIENAYEEELRFFLKSVKLNEDCGLFSYEKDKKVLSLIDQIEGKI